LLKPDGNGKLSKRDGDRLGFPVFPLQWKDPQSRETSSGYRESGYLPDALINMLALLGWNPGTEQEIMSKDELIQLFSIEKVSKSGAKFNLEKAKWFNQQYIQKLSVKTLTEQFLLILKKHNIDAPAEYVENIVALVKERISFINDLWEESNFFFIAPTSFDEQIIKKRWKEDTPQRLKEIAQIIGETSPFQRDSLHNAISEYITQNNLNMGQIMNCLRLSLVGAAKGPDLFEIINLLGANEVVKRINNAISTIAKNNI
jgi:glutamyl-tRNA synthetase